MALFNPVSVAVENPRADNVEPSSILADTTSKTLLLANTDRKGATIFNNSTGRLYVKMGATASTTTFSVLLESGGYYEVPFGYTGAISGIWSNTNGNALVEEFS